MATEITRIEAQEFVLSTVEGQRRAVLALPDGQSPALTLFDADGNARVEVSVDAEGPSVCLYGDGPHGAPGLLLRLTPAGGTQIELNPTRARPGA